MASLLSSTGTPTYELHGTEAVHGSSGQVLPGDVVIAISNSGETTELQATVNTLLANGAHIISCTGNDQSTASGRSIILVKKFISELDIKSPYITNNGAEYIKTMLVLNNIQYQMKRSDLYWIWFKNLIWSVMPMQKTVFIQWARLI